MYHHKEKIYLPQAAIALLETTTNPSLKSAAIESSSKEKNPGASAQKESRSFTESFSEYLDHWQKRAPNYDVSDNLKSAVDKVKDFPENSYAFCVGVGQLFKIASAEVLETSKEIGNSLEPLGLINNLKEYCRKGKDNFVELFEPAYDKISISLEKFSRQLLGEEIHESVNSFLDQYLKPIAQFAIDQINNLLKVMSQEEKAEVSEYKDTSSLSKIDLSYTSKSDRDQNKEEFLNELAHRSSDFLHHAKDFFAHTILDKDSDGSNALTPEILVEGDLRSRPIYDPLPPAWVLNEKQKDQEQISEYQMTFRESAPLDTFNGELSNLAKLNLLSKPKII